MNAKNQYSEKRIYICPLITAIELDNEISLALESSPPTGPDEAVLLNNTENNIDTCFKTNFI